MSTPTPGDVRESERARRNTPKPKPGPRPPVSKPEIPFDPRYDKPTGASPGGNLETQLKALDASLKRLKSTLAELQKISSGIKGTDEASRARKRLFEERIANYKKVISSEEGRRGTVQTKLYEERGEYDKLLSGDKRDAFMAIKALFKTYGLESLATKIYEYVKNGYSADTISILLQDTKEYKQRFAGNEARKKAGLPVLNPAEYLKTEESYRQIMESAGLPKGFYDQNSDFNDFIAKNMSPTELQNRVDMAVQATTLAPDDYKAALKKMGLTQGEMVAYFLDEKKALPHLVKAVNTARIGAEALASGLAFDVGYAEGLAERGVSADQAREGYTNIANELSNLSQLGSIYGEAWNQRFAERAMFEGDVDAVSRKRRLASQERGAFGGATGGARGGLARRGGQN